MTDLLRSDRDLGQRRAHRGRPGLAEAKADFEEVPPDPVATIESLRSLGYSLEAAVADLIDNSIAARIGFRQVNVNVQVHWAGANPGWPWPTMAAE